MIRSKRKFTKKINKKGFYVCQKDHYQNKIIDYPSAPYGKAYIGINKTPLMKNENGIGFQGVVLQDESRQFIQCSGCGEWMKKIAYKHLQKCSNLSVDDYKQKFGLYLSEGLVADETSLKLAACAIKNKAGAEYLIKNGDQFRKNPQVQHKARTVNNTRYSTMSWKNEHGTCDEQIKTRLLEFIKNYREFPGSGNKGKSIYKALNNKFGSFNNAMKKYGLPVRYRNGTNFKFVFPDYTVFKYNLNQMPDREGLFNKIMEKCTLFQQPIF
jgi:hypothetical protein